MPKIQSNFRLPPQTVEQIKTISKFEDVSEAEIIEAAVDYFLDMNYPAEYHDEDDTVYIFRRREKFDNLRSRLKEKFLR